MGSDEKKGGGSVCGSISGMLGFAFFIYLMVAFSTVNIKDLTGLVSEYVDMINWIKTLAYIEFGLIGFTVFFIFTVICCLCVSENSAMTAGVVLFVILFLATFIVQIIFVAQGIPISSNARYICQQYYIGTNHTQMCDFYNSYYNPLFIILCVLLALNSLNFVIIGVAGLGVACMPGESI